MESAFPGPSNASNLLQVLMEHISVAAFQSQIPRAAHLVALLAAEHCFVTVQAGFHAVGGAALQGFAESVSFQTQISSTDACSKGFS